MTSRDLYPLIFDWYDRGARLLPGGYAPPPLHLAVAPTMHCNLACPFCTAHYAASMPRAEVRKIVASFPSARLVTISGGELFTHPEAPDIVRDVARTRLTTLETNGTLIDAGTTRALAALAPRAPGLPGLYLVNTTIHGPEAVHDRITGTPGSHRRALGAAAALVEARRALGRRFPIVSLRTTMIGELAGLLNETRALAAAIGADSVMYKLEEGTQWSLDPHTDAHARTDRFVRYPAAVAGALAGEIEDLRAAAATDGGPGVVTLPFNLPATEIRDYYAGGQTLFGYRCDTLRARFIAAPGGYWSLCKIMCARLGEGERIADAWNGATIREFRRTITQDGLRPECRGCCYLRHPGPRAQ